jgi:hypothetical protein
MMTKETSVLYANLEAHYLPHVAETRGRMLRDGRLRALFEGDLDGGEVLGFLLEFCALAIRLAGQVDSWMRRAGQACMRRGEIELGADIARRAVEEAGHDLMLLDDLFELGLLWERRLGTKVDAEGLLHQPPPDALLRYEELHEVVIEGLDPWAQLGIELEIENMAPVIGPPMIESCQAQLGPEVLRGLSFIRAHVELDQDHSKTNARRIDELLGRARFGDHEKPRAESPATRPPAEALVFS